MSINSVIGQYFEDAKAAGLPFEMQNAMAAQVLRKLRPEWSDFQIKDAIEQVRGSAPGDLTNCKS